MNLRTAVDFGYCRMILTGLLALLITAFAATAAGIYLGSVRELLALIPGLIVLVPPSINMRGSVTGVLTSRLASSMHLGEFEIDFSKSSVLGYNVRASLYVTTVIAFLLGIVAYVITSFFGLEGITLLDFVLISVISGILSGFLVTGISILITIVSYRKEIDLDMIASPAVTTSGDIITLPALMMTAMLVISLPDEVKYIAGIAVLLISLFCLFMSFKSSVDIAEITREILPLLAILSVVGTFAGITYAVDMEELIAFSVFLVLIPPFTGGCGSIGGILCSRLATGMHMGEIPYNSKPGKEIFGYFSVTYLYAVILLPLMAVIAHYSALLFSMDSPGLLIIIEISLIAGLIVVTFVNLIGYATAVFSFKKGFDPDNFGIPVITSFIDLAGATMLVSVINLLL